MTNTRRELPEPAPLWRIFENICSIPHPSGHEKALAEALSMFARERGLAVRSFIMRKRFFLRKFDAAAPREEA